MFNLKQTCGGCPEAYDVFLEDKFVGTMRLRNGYFCVESSGVTVYDAHPKGDGIFEWDEREYHLNRGCRAIGNFLKEFGGEKLFEIDNRGRT